MTSLEFKARYFSHPLEEERETLRPNPPNRLASECKKYNTTKSNSRNVFNRAMSTTQPLVNCWLMFGDECKYSSMFISELIERGAFGWLTYKDDASMVILVNMFVFKVSFEEIVQDNFVSRLF